MNCSVDESIDILRNARRSDLDAINRVIEAAVMGWDLPERVKRLSLPVYRYTLADFDHMQMVVLEQADGAIIGIAACEPADERDAPVGKMALLLHGIYILPRQQLRGLGSRLFEATLDLAADMKLDGLLVKAHPGAGNFFQSRGMRKLPVDPSANEYEYRYWLETV